jgi:diacylglycerol kinase family enzyme
MTHEADKVLLLHNPRSGARHAREIIEAHLAELNRVGLNAEAVDSLDAFQELAANLHAQHSLRAVIAAGGDGTASAVASRVDPSTPLWLCPLGTENLLARYCGMKCDPRLSAASIAKLETRRMDAGRVNGELFLIMVSAGYDAEVVRQVHTRRRGHIRKWHYWWPILKTLFTYSFPEIKFDSTAGCWFFAMNIPRYADGLAPAPMAVDDDGLLDVCTFKHGGLLRGLDYLRSIRSRRQVSHPDFQHQCLKELTVESIDGRPIPFQRDGDFGGWLPVRIEVLPRRLRLVVPSPIADHI